MTGVTPRRWRGIGWTAAGLAVGVGVLGGIRTAIAEPIRAPLLPIPVSTPSEDQPTWTTKGNVPVIPAQSQAPALPAAPSLPAFPPAAAPEPTAPALPSLPSLPASPALITPPTPPAPIAAPDNGTKSKGPVDVRFLRFPPPTTKEELPRPRESVLPADPLPASASSTKAAAPAVVLPFALPEKSASTGDAQLPIPTESQLLPSKPAITLQTETPAPPIAQPVSRPAGPVPSTLLPLPKPDPSSAGLTGDLGFPKLSGSGAMPVVAPGAAGPVPPTTTPATTPGDAPVNRQKMLTAVLGAALATAPTRADEPKPPPQKSDNTVALEALKKDVDALRDDIKKLQTFRKDLEDTVYGKKDGGTGADIGLMSRLDRLDQSIKKLDEQLTKIGDPKPTTALRTDTGSAPALPSTPAAPSSIVNLSHVRIVNDYPVEMSMIVNRKSYRVGPGETRTVDVPPGSYTYELLAAGSQPTTSQIKDSETVTLRIR